MDQHNQPHLFSPHCEVRRLDMSRLLPPVETPAACIRLAVKPQLSEAKNPEDDWTGKSDAAARRRAQTRLNTRAYRKRKALAKKTRSDLVVPTTSHVSTMTTTVTTTIKREPMVECWDESQQTISTIPSSHLPALFNPKTPLLPPHHTIPDKTQQPRQQQQHQFRSVVFPLSPDHLITLLQYNALRALSTNLSLISTLFTTPPSCNATEDTIHTIPYPTTSAHLVPPALLPTVLQQTVPHAVWIDIFPCPVARDRLIRAAGSFDEDDLWRDCIGGLFEGFPDDEICERGVVAWSPPWEIAGWEMTEGFLRKWRGLFGGLPGGLEATNRWRLERGEEVLREVEFGGDA
ncbi:unnamed protein product [Periconia digitata]|uniref:BZIP domain-containing protein n=1 Tax=Periconia digitata TaxID=1303443 RepID=A0A9W4UPS1_9PLEO|nr:unnamed protein product [Periconia digitata]